MHHAHVGYGHTLQNFSCPDLSFRSVSGLRGVGVIYQGKGPKRDRAPLLFKASLLQVYRHYASSNIA